MGLSSTLNIAQSALNTNAALTTLLSRNIAGVNDPNYARRTANLTTDASGAAVLASVSRSTDPALFGHVLSANSDAASSQALSDGLDQLESTVNLTAASATTNASGSTTSPSALLGAFASALQQYESSPDNTASGQGALAAARALTTSLNAASTTVQGVRAQADQDIGSAVGEVNGLLGQFAAVNATIVQGTASGADVSDALDSRDKILTSLSQDMGIMTTSNPDGSMDIFTDSGATLFQGVPRTVSFTPTNTFTAGTVAGTVYVDGTAVTGASAATPLKGGKIAGLATLRDTVTVSYQNQLDQIAGGLVDAFTETKAGGGDPVQGLFTGTAAGAGVTGLASAIAVNPNADPAQGGDVTRLRDGGVGDPSDPAYNTNPSGGAAYSAHLTSLVAALGAGRSFDPSTGGVPQGSLGDFADSSVSWLEVSRQTASTAAADQGTLATQKAASLTSETGVNLDDQLSKMLDLEHSYQASAELISTVKSMFDSLFAAVH